ncbi:hypothetical protein ACFSSB_15585 [Lacinutrix gracilariae]|uniref:YcxB-like protein domain-containing protein n=1 Tax=Lacinutrix gracilariae TaxID=1747198 RepID=A0ABW5K5S4_9FLAO
MSRFPIDIPKSIQTEKLVIKEWLFVRISEYFLYLMFVIAFPFIAIMELNSDLNKNEPIGFSIFFLILSFILSSLLIYSIFNVNSVKRISGLSRGKNSNLIKKIAEKNNWNIQSTNQQMTIINFSWQDSGTDWGKQMTILYNENDILVNCISFGVGSSPSPFHWFANKRKVNKLTAEFENEIKNVLQQRV